VFTLLLPLAAHPIVHVNASLNATATVLLVIGLVMIKRGRVLAHKRVMLTAFAVSVVFLACYVWYHLQVGSVRFTYPGWPKLLYLIVLFTHFPLASTVPFLAVAQIYLGFRAIGCCDSAVDSSERMALSATYRRRHRRLARWTFPIWLYVSVTGVAVYVMLYHLWPPAG
jgi:putative membrane protein